MLSNLYHNGRPLLQVFLIGQPEFRRKLAGNGLEQLRQRIVAIHHLSPLNDSESKEYILSRLRTAGWNDDPSFAEDCFPVIHRETRGVPRLINNLCDRLLWNAFIEEKHDVSREDVDFVVEDMRIDASGLTLDGDAVAEDIEVPFEPESDRTAKPARQAVSGSDRVVDFRNTIDKDG
jgi:hypothetical protein